MCLSLKEPTSSPFSITLKGCVIVVFSQLIRILFALDDTSYTTNGYNPDQTGSDGINDVSCPDNATSLSQCSFTLSNSSDFNCKFHFSDLSVTCSNSKYLDECFVK